MRRSISTTFALALAFTAFAPAAAVKERNAVAVLTPAGDIKWNDVPGFPGVSLAVLEGDPAMGPHHSMMKFKDGFAAPLHHHSSDHFGTVISGSLMLTVDGKETVLPAGSFFSFKGMKEHSTRCAPGADCVIAVDVRGKWDVVPEGNAPAAKN
jgi:mannose-6-phosphate isomerase-like protein (cupin superfamily)